MTDRGRRDRAQALAEFALVVPIFLLFLFGIIDLGRYVFTANAINNGAREGARVGSVANRPASCAGLSREACTKAIAIANSWGVPASEITVAVACERIAANGSRIPVAVSTCRTNDLLKVTSNSPFTLLTPLIAQFLGPLPIEGESIVTVNQ